MRLLFCCEPFKPSQPDPDYVREVAAAVDAGFGWSLIDFEALVEGNVGRALRRVDPAGRQFGVVSRLDAAPRPVWPLYDGLAERGLRLINTPEEYRRCHYLPDYYPLIEGRTPRSVWTADPSLPIAQVMALLEPFGSSPVILKDYVSY